jgi:mono/diheme cytochrome c family protein
MYFYYHDYANFYSLDESFVKTGIYKTRDRGLSLGWGEGEYRRQLEAKAAPRPESKGFIGAFDPLTGEYKWRHQLGPVFNGGVLATTTGLLFQGEGNGQFVARNTATGEPIWSYDALGSFSSSLISYQIDDVQYVATMVTGNRAFELPGTVLVFKLGGNMVLAAEEQTQREIPEQPEVEVTTESYTQGDTLYHMHCANCHRGIGVTSVVATVAPDLRSMTKEIHTQYADIVRGGSRANNGMPAFADTLSEAEIEAIRGFLVTQANRIRSWQESRQPAEESPMTPEKTTG